MGTNLGRAALASLLVLGCTGLNPLYTDATGGQGESGARTTRSDATATDPSLPTDPTHATTTTAATLKPTDASSDSTAEVGPGTNETATNSEDSGGATTDVDPPECSTYVQGDCPPGEKCMPWANDGGTWNALSCFSLEPTDPGDPGDACVVFEAATSGLDNCNESSMCWDVNPANDEGTCVSFCVGSPEAPQCDDPGRACTQGNNGILALCLPPCDPLLQDCAGGSNCVPADDEADGFVCVLDASGEGGALGDPCKFANACDPGNLCANEGELDECTAEACCTSYCDLQTPDACQPPSICVAYYEGGNAPPDYQNVGFCGVD